MARIVTWTPQEAKKNLSQRLADCFDSRRYMEYRWQENERIIFATKGEGSYNNASYSFDYDISGLAGVDQTDDTIGINYAAKNLRFIHAQLSANPPTVIPRPTSNDPDDRRKADAADRLIRYALREYQMQEVVDRASLNTLLYGTGFTKTVWDTESGDILDLDEESGEMTMEGEFKISVPNVWDVFVDPDATCWEEVRYMFQRITIPWEEALFRFPEKKELLVAYRRAMEEKANQDGFTSSVIRNKQYDVVELYEYWEKGLPHNGYLGRFCICTRNGELVTELMPNPERFAPPPAAKTGKKGIAKAVLPYQVFTDIDVPNTVWGKAVTEYSVQLQEMLNKIDTVTLENAQAHGVARIILPEGAEIADDSITNSPWDIIKITGTQPPHFMAPMPMPQIMPDLMARYKSGIDDSFGINEAMLGQQSRETSGFSMQYATNQGNMIRRRLFNKYVLFVESIYKSYLRIVQKHWELPRTIKVLGKEKAFESVDIKGADIDSGFDLVVEYGASLSLDPTSRREEILTLMPLFEKAGVETRQILGMLKLNELSGMYDTIELAKDRQREIFEEMIATGLYIGPEELQDHQNMLQYAYYFLMTTEFKYLTEDEKALVRRHVREREDMAAAGIAAPALGGTPPGPAPGGLGGGAGPGGTLPPLPGGGLGTA